MDFRDFDISSSDNENENKISDFLIFLFDNRNFCDLGIDKSNYLEFVKLLKDNYLQNSYHNFNHAVDATYTLNFLLISLKRQLCPIENFSLLVSMLCHDVGHFGMTGQYVSEHMHEFVEKYGQHSPLEQFHLREAKVIIDNANLLVGMTEDNRNTFFNILSKSILATDPDTTQSKKFFELFNETMLFELLMKCADIGIALKKYNIHEKWVMNLMKEFYIQGNLVKHSEKLQPLFNEDMKYEIPQQQVGFCNFYVKPHFLSLSPYLVNGDEILKFIEENENVWKSKIYIYNARDP